MKPGTTFDRYVLENPISQKGGTASVYLAHLFDDPGRRVALKIAQTNNLGSTHEDVLLQYEARLLGTWEWRHPGIVRIYPTPLDGRGAEYAVRAATLQDQPWYMAMEYLRGKSLAENINLIQRYPIEWRLELFYQILVPVAFIHNNGYAHRDLKPSNIVFRETVSADIAPQPVLIDFALTTKRIGERKIVDNSYTLEYASPERILKSSMGVDAPVDNIRAADVWSLGLIFSEILTGHSLLMGSKKDIRTTIIREELTPNIPNDKSENIVLINLITAMLSKDPESRPSVKLVMHALEEIFLPPWVSR